MEQKLANSVTYSYTTIVEDFDFIFAIYLFHNRILPVKDHINTCRGTTKLYVTSNVLYLQEDND